MSLEKEKISAGLRNMETPPDYFVFIDGVDWTYDRVDIYGIKVIHVEGVHVSFETECRFIPAWDEEASDVLVDTARFYKGYNDF